MFIDIIDELATKFEDTSNDMYEIEEQINQAFKNENISNYDVCTEHVFDSPGCDIYVLFVAWIDSYDTLQTLYAKREQC